MTVVKKDGRRETFSPEKLTKSLMQASSEAGEAVDTNSILVEFYKVVESKTFITTHHIDIVIYGILYYHHFLKTLDAYISYDIKERKKPAPFAKK